MRAIIFIFLSLFASVTIADQLSAVEQQRQILQRQKEALTMLSTIAADKELTRKAYAAGEERITLCGYCHGKDGNSTRTHIPNLAEQTPVYLFTAFEKFATGERKDFVMEKAAGMLSMEDRVNIALYYGLQTVNKKEEQNPELSQLGRDKFALICTACHGQDGQGQDDMPRLAGQPYEYVKETLIKFRAGGEHRPGSQMIPIAKQLSDLDIEAVSSYVQGLNP